MDDMRPGDSGCGHDDVSSGEAVGSGEHLHLAQIDHEEYDALADLFLGDGELAPEPMGGAFEVGDSEPTHATHTPVLHLARHEEDAELGQTMGCPAEGSVVGPGNEALETLEITDGHASDLLAELLKQSQADEAGASLGGSGDAADPVEFEAQGSAQLEFIAMPHPTVEVVVLGHLPVRATLWARQYACSQAKALGETVALVRAASGSTSVDLIVGGDGGRESVPVRRFAHLDGALGAVSQHADRVVLRVDEASEPELLERVEVEEITVLTGADEAAVVASYRLIKALDATLGERYVEGQGPTLRVAVMGAGREQAIDACTKLGNAVETFIERPIEIVVGSGRIDATGTTNLYRDGASHPASHILDGLVRAAASAEEFSEVGVADRAGSGESARVEFPADGVEMPAPKRGCPSRGQDDAPTKRDGLCALIPGLHPIEARCPKAPGVELALDDDGQLHLVVCDADTSDAMNRLLAAQTWARNNLGLLIRAEPDLSQPSADRDVDTDAVMHLISIEPRAVREIYDTAVRIYSLARVKVGDVIAQVATPIN